MDINCWAICGCLQAIIVSVAVLEKYQVHETWGSYIEFSKSDLDMSYISELLGYSFRVPSRAQRKNGLNCEIIISIAIN
jgi:hypothetical protein